MDTVIPVTEWTDGAEKLDLLQRVEDTVHETHRMTFTQVSPTTHLLCVTKSSTLDL